jgi:signal peptidase II
MNPRNLWFVGTLLAGILADQASKVWVAENIAYGVDEISIVPGWFSLVHARNTGAAFSTMEGQLVLFLVFTAIALVVIVDLARRQEAHTRFVPFTLGMILAGALGNGIDRLRLGYVVDFFKAYAGEEPLRSWFIDRWGTNVWPIFNVADSMLLVGVALFALRFLTQREGEIADDEEPEADATA